MKIMMFNHEVYNKFASRKHNFNMVGFNTGNLLFWHVLKRILKAESHTMRGCIDKRVNVDQYGAFVTTDLIWIQENTSFNYVQQQIEIAGDKPLIPISVGLQAKDLR